MPKKRKKMYVAVIDGKVCGQEVIGVTPYRYISAKCMARDGWPVFRLVRVKAKGRKG